MAMALLLTLAVTSGAHAPWQDHAPVQDHVVAQARAEHFEARVRPVLVEHCYGCHNSSGEARGGLALDSRAGIRAESDSGVTVVPGDPAQSLLLQVVRHELLGLEMPQGGARLADEVVADLERWIRDGAYDPRDAAPTPSELAAATSWEATLERRRAWWSLAPITAPTPPAPTGWSEHPVDRFIERELTRHGLAPTTAADARTLLRRVSFALTGLPPTPEALAAFLADDQPGAFERAVDTLLASPHYGERWARHWMDVVRYADSHGSEGDPAIPNAYRYRDYLIRAFNADVPYDQLVREHIAGDLLPAPRIDADLGIVESPIGTAHWRMVFHGFAPTDALDEKVRFVDDEINVLGKAFLAQTIACARCHDHKFDALGQADYYALFGVLASCRPGVLDVNTPERQALHRERLGALAAELRAALAACWTKSLAERLADAAAPPWPLDSSPRGAAPSGEDGASARRLELSGPDAPWFASGNGLVPRAASAAGVFAVAPEGPRVLLGVYPAGVYTHLVSTRHRGVLQSARIPLVDELDVWVLARGDGGAKLRYVVQDYPRGGTVYPLTVLDDNGWAWRRLELAYWKGDSVHIELTTGQDTPVEVSGGERSWFGVRAVVLRPTGSGAPADPAPPGGSPADVARAIDAFARDAATDADALLLDACLRADLLPNTLAASPAVAALVAAYRALEAQVPTPTRVPGLLEADAADHPLLQRGDHRRPGAPVPRRPLALLGGAPYDTTGSGRLELAADLLRPDNPLTARVIVNRVWHHLFGRGLVATPDNFGRLGALPSHPELLDHLATRMIANGWSIKALVRDLVTTRTWQLASTPPPGAASVDPENVWLSHARVRRLDAEALRDALFAAAGRLDRTLYGPAFDADSSTPRRSVYVASRRNALDSFLQAFDSPVPFAPTGARSTTNVPAQSLALMNGALVREVAAGWASDMGADPRFATDEARIAWMFECVTGRPPEPPELTLLADYRAQCAEAARADRAERAALAERITRDTAALDTLLAPARARLRAATPPPGRTNGGDSAPLPLARWDFRAGLADTVGGLHGVAHGTARVTDEGLVLDGHGQVSTPPVAVALRAKTLEAWVRLTDLDQRGGGVVTVQDPSGARFDAIVYGERQPRHWLAGSENFARTADLGGPEETRAATELVHLALVHDADGRVRAYRDGAPYGAPYRKAPAAEFAAGEAVVLFGLRHGAPSPGRALRGVLVEARLHARALTDEEVAASAQGVELVSHADVLAALTDTERGAVAALEATLAEARLALDSTPEPSLEDAPLARVAHALFNLKEFLYVR